MHKSIACFICKSSVITEYAIDKNDNRICYRCCGFEDRHKLMTEDKATLYLTITDKSPANGQSRATVSNWPGTLELPAFYSKGKHNIAGTRYDVWFKCGGRNWYGVSYGENTQLLHCRALKN